MGPATYLLYIFVPPTKGAILLGQEFSHFPFSLPTNTTVKRNGKQARFPSVKTWFIWNGSIVADRNLLGSQTCHQDQQLAVGLRVFEKMKPEVTGLRFAHWQLKYLAFCLTETSWETGKTNQTKKRRRNLGKMSTFITPLSSCLPL